jgi:hypothetical protein
MTGAALLASPVVAKTDSSFSSSVEWQLGHATEVPVRTSASNWLPQLSQAYSYIGILIPFRSLLSIHLEGALPGRAEDHFFLVRIEHRTSLPKAIRAGLTFMALASPAVVKKLQV